MNKKSFLIGCTFLFAIAINAQKLTTVVNYVTSDGTVNNNSIYYQPGQLLTWNDFKGKPVAGSDAVALTDAGFGIKLMFRSENDIAKLVIGVHCSFSRKDSWVTPGNKTAYVLNHEQKHFDIAYIHTFLFIQNLKKAHFTNSNYAAVIEKIYNETAAAMTKTQNQYDMETSHSRLPEKQAVWDEKISKQLAMINEQQAMGNKQHAIGNRQYSIRKSQQPSTCSSTLNHQPSTFNQFFSLQPAIHTHLQSARVYLVHAAPCSPFHHK